MILDFMYKYVAMYTIIKKHDIKKREKSAN